MLESDPYVKQQRQALIVCSKCALVCFVILTGIIAVQAVTGAILMAPDPAEAVATLRRALDCGTPSGLPMETVR